MWLRVGQTGTDDLWPVAFQRKKKRQWKHLEDETNRSRDFSIPLQNSSIPPFLPLLPYFLFYFCQSTCHPMSLVPVCLYPLANCKLHMGQSYILLVRKGELTSIPQTSTLQACSRCLINMS